MGKIQGLMTGAMIVAVTLLPTVTSAQQTQVVNNCSATTGYATIRVRPSFHGESDQIEEAAIRKKYNPMPCYRDGVIQLQVAQVSREDEQAVINYLLQQGIARWQIEIDRLYD